MLRKLKQFKVSATKTLFSKSLLRVPSRNFSSAQQYDVVVIGSNLGSVLVRHLEHLSKEKMSVYVVSGGSRQLEQHHLRTSYELGHCSQENYLFHAQTALSATTPHSDGVKVKSINPQTKTVQLLNGKELNYSKLVIALGLQNDSDAITGLKQAVVDHDHPVFSSSWWSWHDTGLKSAIQDHLKEPSQWYDFSSKKYCFGKNIYPFSSSQGGEMLFYIPEFPFRGENERYQVITHFPFYQVSDYNFLLAYDSWVKNQSKQSQQLNLKMSVVSANSRLCSISDIAEEVLQGELKKRGIEVLLNTKLIEVNKKNRQVQLKQEQNQQITKSYDAVYAIPPTHPHSFLLDAKLCDEKGLVKVNKETLQVEQNPDIYCLGELANLPITPSFYSASQQLNVVRHNILQTLRGKEPDLAYECHTKTPLYLGSNKLTFLEEHYQKGQLKEQLKDKEGKNLAYVNYLFYNHLYPTLNAAYFKFRHWGSPKFLSPQIFDNSHQQIFSFFGNVGENKKFYPILQNGEQIDSKRSRVFERAQEEAQRQIQTEKQEALRKEAELRAEKEKQDLLIKQKKEKIEAEKEEERKKSEQRILALELEKKKKEQEQEQEEKKREIENRRVEQLEILRRRQDEEKQRLQEEEKQRLQEEEKQRLLQEEQKKEKERKQEVLKKEQEKQQERLRLEQERLQQIKKQEQQEEQERLSLQEKQFKQKKDEEMKQLQEAYKQQLIQSQLQKQEQQTKQDISGQTNFASSVSSIPQFTQKENDATEEQQAIYQAAKDLVKQIRQKEKVQSKEKKAKAVEKAVQEMEKEVEKAQKRRGRKSKSDPKEPPKQ